MNGSRMKPRGFPQALKADDTVPLPRGLLWDEQGALSSASINAQYPEMLIFA